MAIVTINLSGGNDVFKGFESGYSDQLIINGLGGNDTLSGADGKDQLYGGEGNDLLIAHGDGDSLHGDAGNDTLDAGQNQSTELYGGPGDDTYVIALETDSIGVANFEFGTVHENAGEGTDTVKLWGNSGREYHLPQNVENLFITGVDYIKEIFTHVLDATNGVLADSSDPYGFSGLNVYGNGLNNLISGSDGFDVIDGGAGNDTLQGGSGGDQLYGGDGNDVLNAGAGMDEMWGGKGNDTYYTETTWDRITELPDEGIDKVVTTSDFYALGDNVENLTFAGSGGFEGHGNALANAIVGGAGVDSLRGGGGDDTLTGNAGNDTLSGADNADSLVGGDGDDSIMGDAGVDTLEGGAGNDTLLGGSGNDFLWGGDGNDVLNGGAGADGLTGGAGADTYVFSAVAHSTSQAPDWIAGFQHGIDKIDLSAVDADATVAGNQSFVFLHEKPFFSDARDLWLEVSGPNTKVFADVDGDGGADFGIVLYNVTNLSASDFVL